MNPDSPIEDPANAEELHRLVLCEAFNNMKRGHSNKVIVSAKNGGEAILNRDLFILFSGMLRDLLSSVPQCPASSISSSIILPDLSVRTILQLQDLLAQGHCEDFTRLEDSKDLLDACRLFGIDIQRINYEPVLARGVDGSVEVEVSELDEEPGRTRRTVEKSRKEGKRIVFVSSFRRDSGNQTTAAEDEGQSRSGGGLSTVPNITIKKEVETEETVENSVENSVENPVENSVQTPGEDSEMEPVDPEPPAASVEVSASAEKVRNLPERKPTLSTLAAAPEKKGVTTPSLYSCEKCAAPQSDLLSLKKHLTTHFLAFFKKNYSKSYQGGKCLLCKSSINSIQKFFVHVSIIHDKLNDALKIKGMKELPPHSSAGKNKNLPPVQANPAPSPKTAIHSEVTSKNQRTTQSKLATTPGTSCPPPPPQTPVQNKSASTPASEKKPLETECNFDLKCQVCQQTMNSFHNLETHLCRHFTRELRESFSHLMDENKCKLCLNTFKQKQSLILHEGSHPYRRVLLSQVDHPSSPTLPQVSLDPMRIFFIE